MLSKAVLLLGVSAVSVNKAEDLSSYCGELFFMG